MNNLLASVFSPSQLAVIITVAVVGVALIVLNIVLAYIFNKRGERKLFDLMLQQQREILMQQLSEMRAKGTADDDKPADIKPLFVNGEEAAEEEPVVEEVVIDEPAVEEVTVAEGEGDSSADARNDTEEETARDDGEEDAEEEEEIAAAILSDEDDESDSEETLVINGKTVRYNRSFAARIIQASDEVKSRYSELKNYVLSYSGVKSRISWKRESFRLGRNTFATFVVRGKTLCLCLATDPSRFNETKYKVVDLSVRSPKNKQPCLYRISSDRRVKYAEEIIDLIMGEYGVERVDGYAEENFKPAYQQTQPLIECGLIKIVGEGSGEFSFGESDKDFAAALIAEEEEGAEPVEEVIINGKVVRYNRSFTARLIQSSDEVKARYSLLKNRILSYDKVRDRVSWKKESFRRGRVTLATFVIRGKTLCLCLATDPSRFNETKYKVVDLSVRSPKNKQPCLYRVSSDRKAKYATELIDLIFGENGAEITERETENYYLHYEPTEQLIEEKLIRVIGEGGEPVVAEGEGDSSTDARNDTGEELVVAAEPVVTEGEVDSSTDARNDSEEESARNDVEDEVLVERDFEILEEVDVAEAETFSDEQAEQLVEVKIVKKKNSGKKGIVNLDSLSRNFEAGAHVTIESLREKNLIAGDIKVLKVLAKGSLNKPLIVEADDFSLVAVKMIVMTGGRVIRRSSAN